MLKIELNGVELSLEAVQQLEFWLQEGLAQAEHHEGMKRDVADAFCSASYAMYNDEGQGD